MIMHTLLVISHILQWLSAIALLGFFLLWVFEYKIGSH